MWEDFKEFLVGRLVNMGSDIEYKYDNSKDVARWLDIYRGNPSWCMNRNKMGEVTQTMESELGASIVSELSRKVTIEMESWIDGDCDRVDILSDGYSKLVDNSRYTTEMLLVHGGVILKPFIDKDDRVGVEVIGADAFMPLKFNKFGELVDVVFVEVVKKGKYVYTKYETHSRGDGGYIITNEAYLGLPGSPGNKKGQRRPLSDVEEWSHLDPITDLMETTGNPLLAREPLFTYMKAPYVNIKDLGSPLGASVLSKAEGLIKDHDEIYSEMMNEYHSTRVRIFIPEDLSTTMTGDVSEMDNDNTYVKVGNPGQDGFDKIDSFSPDIRNANYLEGMEAILRRIEFNCGLAYGDLSKRDDVVKTATEIIASRERSYSSVVDIQKRVEKAYYELVVIMNRLCDIVYGVSNEKMTVEFHFDDSVVDNENNERGSSYEIN